MSNRRKAREIALQILYQMEMVEVDPLTALKTLQEEGAISNEVMDFALLLAKGAEGKKEEIDGIIKTASQHWSVNRMAAIDKSILRMAVFELKYMGDIPYKVTINEAVEIAKRYGGAGSSAFVNGVLDKISKEVKAGC